MLFILIGFGVVTHGLKLLGSELLPIRLSFLSPFVMCIVVPAVYAHERLVKKYVRQYWIRAFDASASQMRLSSFILGKPHPQERGHVKYRNVLAWWMGERPDYTQPKTDEEARELFLKTDVKAVFVPDGYFVRAPKFDTVSRKYVRKLFVPVTKDDVPLKPDEPVRKTQPRFDAYDESEDEITTTNQYEVVYRPPLFGFRIITFILMLWIFSVILVCGVVITANFLGKPFAIVIHYLMVWPLMDKSTVLTELPLVQYEKQWAWNTIQADFNSVFIGLRMMLYGLNMYDKHLIKKHTNRDSGSNHRSLGQLFADEWRFMLGELKFIGSLLSVLFAISLNSIIVMLVHAVGISIPFLDVCERFKIRPGEALLLPLVNVLVGALFTGSIIKDQIWGELQRMVMFGFRIAVDDFLDRLWKPTLRIYARTVVPSVMLVGALIGVEKYYRGDQYQTFEALCYGVAAIHERLLLSIGPLILGLNITYTSSKLIQEYVHKVNAEVKEQYYSKGKTLENSQE
jgi:E3 ubiquitin-protein ligase DOA10